MSLVVTVFMCFTQPTTLPSAMDRSQPIFQPMASPLLPTGPSAAAHTHHAMTGHSYAEWQPSGDSHPQVS